MPICKLFAANIHTSFFYMIRLLGPVHMKKDLLGGLALFTEVSLHCFYLRRASPPFTCFGFGKSRGYIVKFRPRLLSLLSLQITTLAVLIFNNFKIL